jgi:uncharacterized protein (TIGR02145 family)
MKYVLIVCLLSLFNSAVAQTDTLTDSRDGNKYATVTIGNKRWFRDHLRYAAKDAYYPRFSTDEQVRLRGNYYSNTGLDSVCPAGWHVMTTQDWESYIAYLLQLRNIAPHNIKTKTLAPPNNSYAVTLKSINLLGDSLLNLLPIGWVQGKKITNLTTLSLWVTDTQSKDDKYHVHIGELGYVTHTHAHHIIDKPKNIRMFTIRCVCELQGGN